MPRRSRAELRELLVATGRDLVLREGIGTTGEHLTFKRVFQRLAETEGISVTNASVIGRIWSSLGDYRMDVLAVVVADDLDAEIAAACDAIRREVADLVVADTSDRWGTVAQMCRAAVPPGGGIPSCMVPVLGIRLGVRALASPPDAPGPAASARLAESLRSGYQGMLRSLERHVVPLVGWAGLRLRSPYTRRDLATALAVCMEGWALGVRVGDPVTAELCRPTGPDGAIQRWSVQAVVLEALAHQFLEADPTGPVTAEADNR